MDWMEKNVKETASNPGAYQTEIQELRADLHTLWTSPTYTDFSTYYAIFSNNWSRKNSLFMTYFEKQWMTSLEPKSWALFGREQEIPTCGEESVEALNSRIHVILSKRLPMDALCRELEREYLCQHEVMQILHLREERANKRKSLGSSNISADEVQI